MRKAKNAGNSIRPVEVEDGVGKSVYATYASVADARQRGATEITRLRIFMPGVKWSKHLVPEKRRWRVRWACRGVTAEQLCQTDMFEVRVRYGAKEYFGVLPGPLERAVRALLTGYRRELDFYRTELFTQMRVQFRRHMREVRAFKREASSLDKRHKRLRGLEQLVHGKPETGKRRKGT